MKSPRTPLVALAVLGVLAFGGSAPGQPSSGLVLVTLSFSDRPTLVVQPVAGSGDFGISVIEGEGGESGIGPSPARVAIDVPVGYAQNVSAASGDVIGIGLVSVVEGGRESVSVVELFGFLIADDPARYASDPEAQACDPRPHQSVLLFAASALGLRLDMRIFVDEPPPGLPGAAAELVFCPPVPRLSDGRPTRDGPIKIANALFAFDIEGGTTRGTYVWRAFVAPLDGAVADPSRTFELRSTVPVPHRLTMRGRYERKTGNAVLAGRLVSAGKPRRGVKVRLALITGRGVLDIQFLGSTRTTASGAFAFKWPLAKTGTFVASADTSISPCTGPSPAPAGCATNTIPSPGTASARVVVPKKQK